MTDPTAKKLITAIERLAEAVEKLTEQMESRSCARCGGSGTEHGKLYVTCSACGGTG